MAPFASTASFVAAWEAGVGRPLHEKALLLLALGEPAPPVDEPSKMTISERDRRLLDMREALFGPMLEATADCPECGEMHEIGFRTDDARMARATPAEGETLLLNAGRYEVRFRLPEIADVAVVGANGDRADLLRRCIESVHLDGAVVEPLSLPAEVGREVVEAMEKADPQADLQVTLTCSKCGHSWQMAFDIASYLWSDVEDWVRHVLQEVHALASAYGWSEREILGLSTSRRRLYLKLIEG